MGVNVSSERYDVFEYGGLESMFWFPYVYGDDGATGCVDDCCQLGCALPLHDQLRH